MSVLTDRELTQVLNKEVVIHPYEKSCVSSKGYYLRVGYALALNNEASATGLSGSGTVVIPPQRAAFIITREYVWLSAKLIGTFHVRGMLAAKGLLINSTAMDSDWKGQLLFLIYNASDQPVELAAGSPFLTMMLHRVGVPSKSGSPTKFMQVVRERGSLYGEQFLNKLLDYLTNADEQAIKKEFDLLVSEAERPSILFQIQSRLKASLRRVRRFWKGRFPGLMTGLIWLLALVGLGVGLTIQWYWNWLQAVFHFSDPYGPSILIGQLAITISALGVLRSLLKR